MGCQPLAASSKIDPVWSAVCDSTGKLHLDSPSVFKAWVATLANKPVEIIVRQQRRNRSKRANAYWWGVVIPTIADALGYLPYEHEAVHDAVVRKIVGLRPESDPRLEIRQSTHDMDVQDFGVLIEATVIWAATDLGVVVPDPDKLFRMKPRAALQEAA
jgi:hypothetical protein